MRFENGQGVKFVSSGTVARVWRRVMSSVRRPPNPRISRRLRGYSWSDSVPPARSAQRLPAMRCDAVRHTVGTGIISGWVPSAQSILTVVWHPSCPCKRAAASVLPARSPPPEAYRWSGTDGVLDVLFAVLVGH